MIPMEINRHHPQRLSHQVRSYPARAAWWRSCGPPWSFEPEYRSPDALRVTGVNVTTRGAMLDNGTLDATLATFTITEARKKSYNFSRPYYTDHIACW